MYKNIVIQLIKNKSVSEENINEFIVEYSKIKKNRDITGEELTSIKELIKMRIFNLEYAAREAARDLKLNITCVYDKKGNLLHTDVEE